MSASLSTNTEVLSHILSLADRSSIISCLRVSQLFHEISQLHISKVYRHVTIGRDSIKSVFEGINWEGMDEMWMDEKERQQKSRQQKRRWGRGLAQNNAKEPFSYQALFAGTSWDEMDGGWRAPGESRDWHSMEPSSPNQAASRLLSPIYGSSPSDRHARKSYALSKTETVTLCDTWTTKSYDSRYHTHNILHNGKAHQLFPKVETIRVIPLTSAINHVTPLCSAHGDCPFIQEIAPKKLVHRNVTANGFDLTQDPIEELVLFLPNEKWPDDMEYSYRLETLEERLAGSGCGVIKLVFGPPLVENNRSRRHIPIAPYFRLQDRTEGGGLIPIDRLTEILRGACSESKMTHIYGLERARVSRPENDLWFTAESSRKTYTYTELLAAVKSQLLEEREEDLMHPSPIGPFENFRIHRLDEYVSIYPDDELLDHELSGNDYWDWSSTDYWSGSSTRRRETDGTNTQGKGNTRYCR